jgi:hypothetical protein
MMQPHKDNLSTVYEEGPLAVFQHDKTRQFWYLLDLPGSPLFLEGPYTELEDAMTAASHDPSVEPLEGGRALARILTRIRDLQRAVREFTLVLLLLGSLAAPAWAQGMWRHIEGSDVTVGQWTAWKSRHAVTDSVAHFAANFQHNEYTGRSYTLGLFCYGDTLQMSYEHGREATGTTLYVRWRFGDATPSAWEEWQIIGTRNTFVRATPEALQLFYDAAGNGTRVVTLQVMDLEGQTEVDTFSFWEVRRILPLLPCRAQPTTPVKPARGRGYNS